MLHIDKIKKDDLQSLDHNTNNSLSSTSNKENNNSQTFADCSPIIKISSLPALQLELSQSNQGYIEDFDLRSHIENQYQQSKRILEFPLGLDSASTEVILFDGFLNNNEHNVRLLQPGYYGITLRNETNPLRDFLYLGLSSPKVVVQFEVISIEYNDDVTPNVINQITNFPLRPIELHSVSRIQSGFSFPFFKNPASSSTSFCSNATYKKSDNEPQYNFSRNSTENTYKSDSSNKSLRLPFLKSIKNANHNSSSIMHTSRTLKNKGKLMAKSHCEEFIYFFNSESHSLLKITAYTSFNLGCRLKCAYKLSFCGYPISNPVNELVPFQRSVSILALDGGGVLGLSSLRILERIELELQKRLCYPEARLIDCFDLLCGTSTGSIIALALLKRMRIKDMIQVWGTMAQNIFKGNRSFFSGNLLEGYDINNLKKALAFTLGQKFMNSYRKPYCFVTSTNVKHKPFELFLLRNYKHHFLSRIEYKGYTGVPLWVAAWSSSSAPTYLVGPDAKELSKMGLHLNRDIQLCDGALKANNPTMVALEEASRLCGKSLRHFIETDLHVLLSVGTGQPTARQTVEKKTHISTLQILLNSGHLLTSGTTVHREVLRWIGDKEDCYYRLNVPGISDIRLDSCDKRSYDLILKATDDYLSDEKYYDIQRLVKKLLNQYVPS